MQSIVFTNPGELDLRLISTFGVNVKPTSASPIGYFGTGLKYAIAVALRCQQQIVIQSGLAEFTFSAEATEIRGKTFDLIKMYGGGTALDLGFTTELGKNWHEWMVYRELWCNARDEAPATFEPVEICSIPPRPRAGLTRIIVSGGSILDIHANRSEFILDSQAQVVLGDVEVHAGPGRAVFYRGIAVRTLPKPGHFTYNILNNVTLTEDRTVSGWESNYVIARALAKCSERRMLGKIIVPGQERFESELDWSYHTPGEAWMGIAQVAAKADPLAVHASVRGKVLPAETETVCSKCGRPF